MEVINLQPQFYVVNFAHRNLNLQYPRAAFRILQGFKKKSTAQDYSNDIRDRYGLDCFLMQKNKPMIIPNGYYFKKTQPKLLCDWKKSRVRTKTG